ncbi:MAG: TGS domain-containing protein, partial [Solirubrobacteraceae bacterium]
MDYELPDGTTLSLDQGATGADAAAAIGAGLARAALAIRVDGELRDLSRPLPSENGTRPPKLEILTERGGGEEALQLVRHDAAHVLAAAMLELYPGVKISIGPAIENGFYYDFDFPDGVTVNDADFPAIEAAMKGHIDADEPFVREEVSVQDALQRFHEEKQPYKVELIEDLIKNEGATTVSLYTNGPFTDLCRGPHAPTT